MNGSKRLVGCPHFGMQNSQYPSGMLGFYRSKTMLIVGSCGDPQGISMCSVPVPEVHLAKDVHPVLEKESRGNRCYAWQTGFLHIQQKLPEAPVIRSINVGRCYQPNVAVIWFWPPVWLWLKTQYPSEFRNRWEMDISSPKNMEKHRFRSIPIFILSSDMHFAQRSTGSPTQPSRSSALQKFFLFWRTGSYVGEIVGG